MPDVPAPTTLTFGELMLRLDHTARIIIVQNHVCKLSQAQYQLFLLLLRHSLVFDAQIAQELYGCALDTHIGKNISKIAAKLRERLHPSGILVQRITNQGYMLVTTTGERTTA